MSITSVAIVVRWHDNEQGSDIYGITVHESPSSRVLSWRRNRAPTLEGPHLPFMLDRYSSQSWTFDNKWIERILRESQHCKKMVIEVGLATGEIARKGIDRRFFE